MLSPLGIVVAQSHRTGAGAVAIVYGVIIVDRLSLAQEANERVLESCVITVAMLSEVRVA